MDDPDILRANDEIARKFGRIEANLADCGGIGELFERLLSESREAFGIPFVWLSLLGIPETEALREILGRSDLLRHRINIIAPAPFLEIVPDVSRPLLASGELRPFFRLMPQNVKYVFRSLAVVPLFLRGALIGSLNYGDVSPKRYRLDMETSFLDHLARTVSEQISRFLPPGSPAAKPAGH
jgi:two-component system, cell cycle response regulator